MYDSIDSYLSKEVCPNINFLEDVPQHLTSVTSQGESNFGVYIIGYLDNQKITITEERVKFSQASLCKYFLGDNFKSLTREDTSRAIEQMCDSLHLPVDKAQITRIDVAQNIIMKKEVGFYLTSIGEANHYKRLEQPYSLYFTNKKRQLIFYDKVREQKEKRQPIPVLYQGRNTLRYELRFRARLNEQFYKNKILAKDLYEEKFYRALIKRWKEEYFSINKIKSKMNVFNAPSGKKEFAEQLAFLSLMDIGQSKVLDKIKEWQVSGDINKRQAFESREFVRRISNIKLNSGGNDLILELDKKINEIARYS